MLFDSALYIWFFLIVFVGYWTLLRQARARVFWLLAASWIFYASWNPKYLGLIILSTIIDYFLGRAIHEAKADGSRKLFLWMSLGSNLGMLGVFKYYDFFAREFAALLTTLGWPADPILLSVLLPVGISFYTFQTMSYSIDIYRREIEPIDDFWRFALFVSFFPQLVAGPIVRASEFLPQLKAEPRFNPREHGVGLFLIATGLIKKVAIANYLATNLVDRVFEAPSMYSTAEVLCGVYGYAVQIYCDFSGYSDVAIGSALLLGFKLADNFDRPYRSRNLQDFWRRWHISLSSWLRDYLYISLGGNRHGAARTYINLALTMLLGGLWHGASWNFVIWGALHGGLLALNRMFQRAVASRQGLPAAPAWLEWVFVFLTFQFVCAAWVFFRARTFDGALEVFSALTTWTWDAPNVSWLLATLIFGSLAVHLTPRKWEFSLRDRFAASPVLVQAVILVIVAIALNQIKGLKSVPFIYFQF